MAGELPAAELPLTGGELVVLTQGGNKVETPVTNLPEGGGPTGPTGIGSRKTIGFTRATAGAGNIRRMRP